ncbi:MAG: GYD domain-containing protein [Acidimicrobiia bacterium]
MAKYLVIATYSPEGIKGVIKHGGTARSDAVRNSIEKLGGTMESFYFAFGEADAYVTVDLPDNVTAAAMSMAVSSTGLAASRVVVLLSPAEVDAASQQQVSYTPPGK